VRRVVGVVEEDASQLINLALQPPLWCWCFSNSFRVEIEKGLGNGGD